MKIKISFKANSTEDDRTILEQAYRIAGATRTAVLSSGGDWMITPLIHNSIVVGRIGIQMAPGLVVAP